MFMMRNCCDLITPWRIACQMFLYSSAQTHDVVEDFNSLDLGYTLSPTLWRLLIPVGVIIIRRALLGPMIIMKRVKFDIILLHQRLIPPQPIQQLTLWKTPSSLPGLSSWDTLNPMFDTV